MDITYPEFSELLFGLFWRLQDFFLICQTKKVFAEKSRCASQREKDLQLRKKFLPADPLRSLPTWPIPCDSVIAKEIGLINSFIQKWRI